MVFQVLRAIPKFSRTPLCRSGVHIHAPSCLSSESCLARAASSLQERRRGFATSSKSTVEARSKIVLWREVFPWIFYGASFNSVLLVSSDFVDFAFAGYLGLPPLAASGMANTILAAVGIAMLQVLPGSLDVPCRATERPEWIATIRSRIAGIFIGFMLGMWPLFWPEEWRMWKITAASSKRVAEHTPNAEEATALKSCMEHFPESLEGPEVDEIVYKALKTRGWTSATTIFAHSTCPDEMNYDHPTDIVNCFAKRWCKRFTLGGLGGMPFSGKSVGWSALVGTQAGPERGGHIIILYGPHVGIGSNGAVGMFRRNGHNVDSVCCGAAAAAYNATSFPTGEDVVADMQRTVLAKKVQSMKPTIDKNPVPMKALAYVNYEITERFMQQEITSPEQVCIDITVIGGITVNLPGNLNDRFVPLVFETLDCKTGEIVDHHDLFGVERQSRQLGNSTEREPFFKMSSKNIVAQLEAGTLTSKTAEPRRCCNY